MTETSTERLLSLLEEILSTETRAKTLYDGYLRTIADESISGRLARIRDDEVEHAQIASDLTPLIRYKEHHRIRESFKGFTDGSVTLVSCSVDKYTLANSSIVRHLVNERGFRCIYVSMNKPSTVLANIFSKEGIDLELVSFIDSTTLEIRDEKRVIVKPDNPTDLSIAIDNLTTNIPGSKFVYLDTVSMLYLFRESDIVEKFVLSQVHRLRAKLVGFVLMAVREEIDQKALARLTVFCDSRVEL